MNRRLAVLCVAAIALSVAAGTGSFTNAASDRDVDVRVVEDDDAYLGVVNGPLRCGNQTLLYNRFGTTLTEVRIGVTVDSGSVKIAGNKLNESGTHFLPNATIGSGERLQVTVPTAEHVDAKIEWIAVEGAGVSAKVDRSLMVSCAGPSTSTPQATDTGVEDKNGDDVEDKNGDDVKDKNGDDVGGEEEEEAETEKEEEEEAETEKEEEEEAETEKEEEEEGEADSTAAVVSTDEPLAAPTTSNRERATPSVP